MVTMGGPPPRPPPARGVPPPFQTIGNPVSNMTASPTVLWIRNHFCRIRIHVLFFSWFRIRYPTFQSSFTSNWIRIRSGLDPGPEWFFPCPDPAKNFGFDRIRIHNTAPSRSVSLVNKTKIYCCHLESRIRILSISSGTFPRIRIRIQTLRIVNFTFYYKPFCPFRFFPVRRFASCFFTS